MARVPSRSSLVSGKGHRLKRREARDTAAGSGNMVGLSGKWRRYLSLQQAGKTLQHFFYTLFRDMLIYRCTVITPRGFDALAWVVEGPCTEKSRIWLTAMGAPRRSPLAPASPGRGHSVGLAKKGSRTQSPGCHLRPASQKGLRGTAENHYAQISRITSPKSMSSRLRPGTTSRLGSSPSRSRTVACMSVT